MKEIEIEQKESKIHSKASKKYKVESSIAFYDQKKAKSDHTL